MTSSIKTNTNIDTAPVAVLGVGSIGTRHLAVLTEASEFSPIAVPLRSERVAQLATEGLRTAKDLADAAAQGATWCIIATDTGRHVKDGITALDSGLHVLVEKPMATGAAEAAKLLKHSQSSGQQLFVGCVMRFTESLDTFRRLLSEVGELHSVRIECQSYLPDWRPQRSYLETYAARSVEGGVLLDLIHEVDYSGWIFGWPHSVQARVRNLGRLGIAADEAVELFWETPQGCAVSVNLDYLSKPPRRIMRAYGSQGTLEWDGFANTVKLFNDDCQVKDMASSQTRNETFLAQSRAVVKSLKGGQDSRLADPQEGIKALAVCDAARRSSVNKAEEAVAYR